MSQNGLEVSQAEGCVRLYQMLNRGSEAGELPPVVSQVALSLCYDPPCMPTGILQQAH